MKICYLADASHIHVQRWISYFADNRHEVSVITLKPPETKLKGVKTYILDTSRFGREHVLVGLGFNISQIKKLLRQIRPDVLHAHFVTGYGAIASFLGFHPLVISAWGGDVLITPKLKKYLAKRALGRADLLHCDGIKPWKAMEKLGANNKKINRIYFGIDGTNFNPKKRSIEFRKTSGLGQSPVIISVRQLKVLYDVETLIRAIPNVIGEIPGAKFIIGSYGPLKEHLEKLAKELQVSKNTIFTGRISDADFPYYLASSDIYVSTSLSDAGLAASTGEAMACGLPVIVTEDPDNREWIKDGVNGFVIPVKNPGILANRIIELGKNEKLRKDFGKLNRKIITKRNDYNTEMRKMEIEYERLITN